MTSIPFTLTRYLYIKEDVMISLIISVFEKKYDQSLFWSSELYYSGYENEIALFIVSLYDNFFRSNNPKLQSLVYILKTSNDFQKIPIILKNLTAKPRKFTLQDFVQRNPYPNIKQDAYEKETKLIIRAPIDDYKKYAVLDNTKTYNILKKACKYSTVKLWGHVFQCSYINNTHTEIMKKHRENWDYYASFCPLWEKRIKDNGGIIDHKKECVNFSDEYFDLFHDKYNYEIDEQSKELFEKISHVSEIVKYDINKFYKEYEPNLKIRVIKKNK